jgi:hypothetical protein
VAYAGVPAKCEASSLLNTFDPLGLRITLAQLLFGISLVVPILGVRMAYAVIAAFSSEDLYGINLSPDPTLRKLNPITGEWYLYLVLGPVMEYLALLLYILASVVFAQRYSY